MFLKPPNEPGTKTLWKLLITVYDLCDDPSICYLRIKTIIENAGASKSKFDDVISTGMKMETRKYVLTFR